MRFISIDYSNFRSSFVRAECVYCLCSFDLVWFFFLFLCCSYSQFDHSTVEMIRVSSACQWKHLYKWNQCRVCSNGQLHFSCSWRIRFHFAKYGISAMQTENSKPFRVIGWKWSEKRKGWADLECLPQSCRSWNRKLSEPHWMWRHKVEWRQTRSNERNSK